MEKVFVLLCFLILVVPGYLYLYSYDIPESGGLCYFLGIFFFYFP